MINDENNNINDDVQDPKSYDKGMGIYDDEAAVAAVGSLFEEEPAAETMRREPERKAPPKAEGVSPRRAPAREYKVREYFSDKEAAEEAELAEYEDSAAPLEEIAREERTSAKKETYAPEDEDYSDYIKAMSRENAEFKKKKSKNSFTGSTRDESRDGGMVRDASLHPAVKKEREQRREKMDDNPMPMPVTPKRPPASRRETEYAEPERGRGRVAAYQHDDEPRTAERNVSGRPVPKYPTTVAGKSGRAAAGAFFEPEDRREAEPGGASIFTDARVILAIAVLAFLVLAAVFFFQNMNFRREIAEARDSVEELSAARAENTRLQIELDGLEAEMEVMASQLEYLEQIFEGHVTPDYIGNGTDNGAAIGNGIDRPPNPTPDPMAEVGIILHTVQRGENLGRIAQIHGIPRWQTIMEFNNLPNEHIREGQVLEIPIQP